MSEKLEPGPMVGWTHNGRWKVGMVIYGLPGGVDGDVVVQCADGFYFVEDGEYIPVAGCLAEAKEIVEEIASAGVEYDARKYLVVQIAPDLIERAKHWLQEFKSEAEK